MSAARFDGGRRKQYSCVREPISGAEPLVTIRHLVEAGADDRPVRRSHTAGELVRIRRGAYSDSDAWEARDAGERYDLRIAAVLATRRSEVVLSHQSAARVWGLPTISPWPTTVHITEPPTSKRRSKNGVLVHRLALGAESVERVDGVLVTGLPRTLLDLARDASFRDAVAALDFARAPSGHGCTVESVLTELEAHEWRASRRVLRAIEFSTDLSMSPLESLSRIVLAELRFPEPQLQQEIHTSRGRRFADFWWGEERVVGECDGYVKYSEERFTGRRTAEEVVWEEKRRENELRELGIGWARWDWRDCFEPERIAMRLRNAGLRQSSAAPRIPRHETTPRVPVPV
jgi:hypothetical protein